MVLFVFHFRQINSIVSLEFHLADQEQTGQATFHTNFTVCNKRKSEKQKKFLKNISFASHFTLTPNVNHSAFSLFCPNYQWQLSFGTVDRSQWPAHPKRIPTITIKTTISSINFVPSRSLCRQLQFILVKCKYFLFFFFCYFSYYYSKHCF